jgi:hypothetical protein
LGPFGGGGAKFHIFAYRAADYRRLAAAAPNEKLAAARLALANMFLQMCGDLRRIESTAAQLAEEAAKKTS